MGVAAGLVPWIDVQQPRIARLATGRSGRSRLEGIEDVGDHGPVGLRVRSGRLVELLDDGRPAGSV
jgi:hypothetical protein